MQERPFYVGGTRITKVLNLTLNDFTLEQLLPGVEPESLLSRSDKLDSRTYDPKSGKITLSVHTWVVHHEGRTLLIDTGAGNGKSRKELKALDHLNEPYLERLRRIGVEPEHVDYILLTHIHADHVGWNTVEEQDRWRPTFPNATVLCSDREWRYSAALTNGDTEAIKSIRAEAGMSEPERLPTPGVFSDSMAPIEAAGQLKRIVVDGEEVLRGVRFLPTPGHSIDHAAISISSQGHDAIFGGDVVHHPFELKTPEFVSMFCEFPEAAKASRRRLASHAAASDALYFSSHFPLSSAGHVTRDEGGYEWTFAEPDSRM